MPFRQGSSRYTVLAGPSVDGPVAYRRARDRTGRREVLLIRLPVAPPENRAQRRTLQIRAERVSASHRVDHPGASGFEEVFVEGGALYAVAPIPPGTPLRIADRRPDAVRLTADLLDIVEVAHAAGHGHGWIDPDTVWVGPGGGVHLIGFGVRELSTVLRCPEDGGDPDYRAPETQVGEDPGPAADLYGIGAVVHFALVGRPPDGHADRLPGPAALAAVLGRLLARDPGSRPRPGAVRSALQAVTRPGEPEPGPLAEPAPYAPRAWVPAEPAPHAPRAWVPAEPPWAADTPPYRPEVEADPTPPSGWSGLTPAARAGVEPVTRQGPDAFHFPAPRLPEPLPPRDRATSRPAGSGRTRRGVLLGGGVLVAGAVAALAYEGIHALRKPARAGGPSAEVSAPYPTVTTPGAPVWSQPIPPGVLRRPRLLDGVILVEATSMVVLRTGDGSLAWELLGAAHHLTVADGVLYIQQGSDAQRTLSAVDPGDGTVAYTANITGSIQALTVSGGTGFVLGSPHEAAPSAAYLRSIDIRTGRINWNFPADLNLGNYPIVDAAHVYAGGTGTIWAVDRATGAVRWQRAVPGGGRPSPRGIAAGLVIVRGPDGTYALDPATGAIRWRLTAPDLPYLSSQAAVDGAVLYLGSGAVGTAGRVRAVRAADGQERWQVAASAAPNHAMTSGGVVYVTGGPTLDALDPADGAVRWRCPLSDPCPVEAVAGDGQVFAATATGRLHAVRSG